MNESKRGWVHLRSLRPTASLPRLRMKLYNFSADALLRPLDARSRHVAVRAVACDRAGNESAQSCISEDPSGSCGLERNMRVAVGLRNRGRDYWPRRHKVSGPRG